MFTRAEVKCPNSYLFIDVGWRLNASVHLNSYRCYAVVGLLIIHVAIMIFKFKILPLQAARAAVMSASFRIPAKAILSEKRTKIKEKNDSIRL